MLRLRNFLIFTIASVLLTNGPAVSQPKGNSEVTVTRCWQFPAENVVGLATNGKDIFAGRQDGHVVALTTAGEKLWETELGGEISSLSFSQNDVVVVSPGLNGINAVAHHLAVATGLPTSGSKDLDLRPAPPADTTASASGSDGLIVGNDSGLVTSLSGTGPVWKFKTGGAISAIVAVGDLFVVISRDNFVYALRARNGALEWKRRLTGRVSHYAVTQKYLIVSSFDQHGVSLIDLGSGRVAGQVLLEGDDQLALDPVVVGDKLAFATSAGLGGYSLSGCGQKETASKP